MNHFENQVLRLRVLEVLSECPQWTGAVFPVEKLSVAGRVRSSAEYGKGTPDILGSVRWRRGGIQGAQFVALELKSPALPAGPFCAHCWLVTMAPRCHVCAGEPMTLRTPIRKGTLDDDQKNLHAAWIVQGRTVAVIRSPWEAVDTINKEVERLRSAGLEVL